MTPGRARLGGYRPAGTRIYEYVAHDGDGVTACEWAGRARLIDYRVQGELFQGEVSSFTAIYVSGNQVGSILKL